GSPAMNLVEGRLDGADGRIVCRIGDQAFILPDGLLAASRGLREAVGRPVAIGIRPESLSLSASPMQPTLTGTTVIAESLGFETLVHVALKAKPVMSADVLDSAPDTGTAALAAGDA